MHAPMEKLRFAVGTLWTSSTMRRTDFEQYENDKRSIVQVHTDHGLLEGVHRNRACYGWQVFVTSYQVHFKSIYHVG